MKLKAINNWVFVKRDEQATTHSGLDISDEAQIKNMLGEIVSIGNEKIARVGQRVHIPHFQVRDCEVDGEEYAVFKDELLFAVQEGDDFRPINGYVMVTKCVNDHVRGDDDEIILYQTENFIEKTSFVEIVDIAGDCKIVEECDIGSFCISPESNERLQRLLYSKDYMVHEELLKFTTDGD